MYVAGDTDRVELQSLMILCAVLAITRCGYFTLFIPRSFTLPLIFRSMLELKISYYSSMFTTWSGWLVENRGSRCW